jgi:hypothetical protein
MKLTHVEILVATGPFARSKCWSDIHTEIERAIGTVVWPPGSPKFVINSDKGRGRGEGNGVVPIKKACMQTLAGLGWNTKERQNRYRFDALRHCEGIGAFGLEWETGNISSSHRAINRILLARKEGAILGGGLILPTRSLYEHLTDRIGNYTELEPYFVLWRDAPWKDGVLAVFAVEHDAASPDVPRIPKGTNGRAER